MFSAKRNASMVEERAMKDDNNILCEHMISLYAWFCLYVCVGWCARERVVHRSEKRYTAVEKELN